MGCSIFQRALGICLCCYWGFTYNLEQGVGAYGMLGIIRVRLWSVKKTMYFSYKAAIRYEVHTVLYKAVFNVSSVTPKQNVKQTVKKLWMSASKESYSGYHIMLIYTIGQSKVGQSRRRWLSQRRT